MQKEPFFSSLPNYDVDNVAVAAAVFAVVVKETAKIAPAVTIFATVIVLVAASDVAVVVVT